MCGISGIYNFSNEKVNPFIMHKINDKLIHRGPDYGQVKVFGKCAIGHRRLSIIDLSKEANQPMKDDSGRFWIVFNGEVYNFLELKDKMEGLGINFITRSDTEVVLKSFILWGNDCFSKFNGMFALAIYDTLTETLILARDQFGIKPLYYLNTNDRFIFASEMKAIAMFPYVQFTLNHQALVEYFWFENPMGENTIYNEIKELKPGSFLTICTKHLKETQYFDINNIAEISITEADAVDRIRFLIEESIKRHLISDVQVGIFLSGGIDSSAITAFASKHYKGKLKTYSVAFDFDRAVNELDLAREIAKKFNTDHHELQIKGNDLPETIETLVKAHDEPFGDAADIPLYLLTKNLKGSIKVVLQGDGGDEFFGGYSRYNTVVNAKMWSRFSFLVNIISLTGIKNTRVLRIQRFLNAISQKDFYKRNALLLTMESKYSNPFRVFNPIFRDAIEYLDPFKIFKELYLSYNVGIDPVQAMFYADSQIVLKDTYLEKVDKSTMANSIEVRVPFVDKELADFALSIPASLKIKFGTQKYLLKKALEGTVPNKILYGKKKGFGVPYGHWLRTTLASYFIEQISTVKVEKYLDKIEILRMYELHKKDKGNYGFLLWKVLIFAIWINNSSQI